MAPGEFLKHHLILKDSPSILISPLSLPTLLPAFPTTAVEKAHK